MRILMPCLLVLTMVELAVAQEQGDEGDEGEDRIAGAAALGYLATSGNTDSKHVNGSFDLVYTLRYVEP